MCAISAFLRSPDDRAGAARDAELDAAINELAAAIRADEADPIGAATLFAPALRARLTPFMRVPTGAWPLRVVAGDVPGIPTLVNATVDRIACDLAEKVLAERTEAQERRIRELQHENEQLHRVAVRDAKTGLLNYNFFRQQVQQELDRAIRYGMPPGIFSATAYSAWSLPSLLSRHARRTWSVATAGRSLRSCFHRQIWRAAWFVRIESVRPSSTRYSRPAKVRRRDLRSRSAWPHIRPTPGPSTI